MTLPRYDSAKDGLRRTTPDCWRHVRQRWMAPCETPKEGARVIERCGERRRAAINPGALTGELHDLVRVSMQPSHVAVWLRR